MAKAVFKTTTAAITCLMLSGCAAGSGLLGGGGSYDINQAPEPISAQDRQQGAEYHPQLMAEFGGEYTGPGGAYVERVGKNIASQSGLANGRDAYTVTLLNSSVNNAFAIPGGYVYTTRQLVGLMDNEAELAAVLGHEVGHVAAQHSQRRQAEAQRNSIFGTVGAILSSVFLGGTGIGDTVARGLLQGSQFLTLSYSRGQELEADKLGALYLNRAGYDERAMATVLASLAQQNALDARMLGRGETNVPAWASTHPEPEKRVNDALAEAQKYDIGGITARDQFLNNIDGMLYGDDPKQGVVENGTFIHPELRLAFRAPQGFYLVNGTRAVTIGGQSGQGQFTYAPYQGNLDNYVRTVFAGLSQQQQIQPSSVQRTTVNGLPAAYGTARINNGNSQVDATVFAYEFSNGQAFHFLTVTQAGNAGVFNPMYQSVRRISQSEAAAVRPRKIDIYTVRSGDTVRSIANRMSYTNFQLERFMVLNDIEANSNLRAGDKVKIVTY